MCIVLKKPNVVFMMETKGEVNVYVTSRLGELSRFKRNSAVIMSSKQAGTIFYTPLESGRYAAHALIVYIEDCGWVSSATSRQSTVFEGCFSLFLHMY